MWISVVLHPDTTVWGSERNVPTVSVGGFYCRACGRWWRPVSSGVDPSSSRL